MRTIPVRRRRPFTLHHGCQIQLVVQCIQPESGRIQKL